MGIKNHSWTPLYTTPHRSSHEGKDMTPTDIERLAREAGMWQDGDRWFTPGKSALDVSTAQLARFSALVEAVERERCANVCEEIDDKCPECAGHNAHDQCVIPQAWQYAAAIRGAA